MTHSTHSADAEREAFEEWLREDPQAEEGGILVRNGETYENKISLFQWQAWQARAAAQVGAKGAASRALSDEQIESIIKTAHDQNTGTGSDADWAIAIGVRDARLAAGASAEDTGRKIAGLESDLADAEQAVAYWKAKAGAPAETPPVVAWYADTEYDLNEDKQGDWPVELRTHRAFVFGATPPAHTKWDWKPLVDRPISGAPAETPKPDDDSFKPVYWFSVLTKCARLLNLPPDEPIPSGVLKAVENLATATIGAGEGKDAARLDWLDAQSFAYGFEDMHEGNRWSIDGPFASIRAAIDAAMRSKTSPGEAG